MVSLCKFQVDSTIDARVTSPFSQKHNRKFSNFLAHNSLVQITSNLIQRHVHVGVPSYRPSENLELIDYNLHSHVFAMIFRLLSQFNPCKSLAMSLWPTMVGSVTARCIH